MNPIPCASCGAVHTTRWWCGEDEERVIMAVCAKCGGQDEIRFGFCFDCASAGEERAANRTVVQHIERGLRNLAKRNGNHRFDFAWAWERATKTGDYRPGGIFERDYGIRL